jgi:hypothetical protein
MCDSEPFNNLCSFSLHFYFSFEAVQHSNLYDTYNTTDKNKIVPVLN